MEDSLEKHPDYARRIAFADFLRQISAGTISAIEWQRYMVTHYRDETLEEIRRQVVRMSIGKAGAVQWSDSELDALQFWSRTLRGTHKAEK